MADVGEDEKQSEDSKNESYAEILRKEHAKDMDEIEKLGISNSTEERLHSLELFALKFPKLPFGRSLNYIEKMKSDSDPDVKEKANQFYDSKMKPNFRWIEETQKYFELSIKNLKPNIDALEQLQKSYSASQNIANIIGKNLNKPVNKITSLSSYQKAIEALMASLESSTSSFDFSLSQPSAITTSREYVKALKENPSDEKTLPETLGTPAETIKKDLRLIQSSKNDASFNIEGYRSLYEIERTLREVIQMTIIEPNEKNLGNVIPKEVLDNCLEIQKLEKKSKVVTASERWVDYSDFTDLERILRKGGNKNRLKEFINEQEFETVVSKLHELDPIRKKIAHSRPLTIDELNRIMMYGKDIIKLLSKKKSL